MSTNYQLVEMEKFILDHFFERLPELVTILLYQTGFLLLFTIYIILCIFLIYGVPLLGCYINLPECVKAYHRRLIFYMQFSLERNFFAEFDELNENNLNIWPTEAPILNPNLENNIEQLNATVQEIEIIPDWNYESDEWLSEHTNNERSHNSSEELSTVESNEIDEMSTTYGRQVESAEIYTVQSDNESEVARNAEQNGELSVNVESYNESDVGSDEVHIERNENEAEGKIDCNNRSNQIYEDSSCGVMNEESSVGISEEMSAVMNEESDVEINEEMSVGMNEESDVGISEGMSAVMNEESGVGICEEMSAVMNEESDFGISEEMGAVMNEESDVGISEEMSAVMNEECDVGISEEMNVVMNEESDVGIYEEMSAVMNEESDVGISEKMSAVMNEESDVGINEEMSVGMNAEISEECCVELNV